LGLPRFAKYAWGVLGLNVLVILWGAVVKATGSGAGCGEHWPLCNGLVAPRAPAVETLIEFTHRMSSGLALLGVAGLLLWAFRAYPAGHRVRRGAVVSAAFIIVEALLGAALVLFGWTAYDRSIERVFMQPIHLTNTLLLLGAILFTARAASGGAPLELGGQGRLLWAFAAGALGLIIISGTGSLISLGDLLFPAANLAEGLAQKFEPSADFLVRLRLWHPGIAIAVGLYLVWLALSYGRSVPTPTARRLALGVVGLVAAQWAAGVTNVLLLVPLWTQIVHLFLADAIWIVLLLWAAEALARRPAEASAPGTPRPAATAAAD
jgi:heme A synthase